MSTSTLVPVQFSLQANDLPPKGTHVYSWIDQEFATQDCPDCFAYPLRVLQGLLQDPESAIDDKELLSDFGVPLRASHVVIPTAHSPLSDYTLAHPSQSSFDPRTQTLLDPSAPKEIRRMVTETGVFYVLKNETEKRIDIQVHLRDASKSVLRICPDFEFVTLWSLGGEAGWESQMYAVHQAPNLARNTRTGDM